MQRKKSSLPRNTSREQSNTRAYRWPKQRSVAVERKVTDLITSSVKKQNNARTRRSKDMDSTKELNFGHIVMQNETIGSLANGNTFHPKLPGDRNTQCVLGTIFSPAFHFPKDGSGGIPEKVDFAESFKSKEESNLDQTVGNPKVDALTSHAKVEKENTVENRLEVASSCGCDNGNNLMARPSNSSSMSSDHSHIHLMESEHANSSCDEEYSALGNISPEVSAIYLAMQHSELECVDEAGQESMSTSACVDSEDDDDFDDFDPFLFIKNLPDLSIVVPTFRPMLLPRQTRSCPSTTLVLDLDETLVHSTLEPCDDADFTFTVNFNLKELKVYVRCRPHLKDFMEKVSGLFEIIIFTASQSIYAERLLNVLDPKRKLFRHRVYRESCVYVEGNYLKDLSVLGRDLSRVIIVDNSPQAFGFQIDNGIPIESWFDDRSDRELLSLLPFLESLVDVQDVRPFLAKKFNLREKVAAAACLGSVN